mgnify:CR=1 FL=1
MRIAKYIANAGVCSRRQAEKLIDEKKVKINNILCEHPSTQVSKDDKIIVNNKIVKINLEIRLWKMYKPKKIICTNFDPKKRETIYSILPSYLPRLISIGRLDFMSEGLILFTNNGDFARKYELPSNNFVRIYRVCISGMVKKSEIIKINKGITYKGIRYNKAKAKVEKIQKPYTWLIFKLREGKNREIRNICKYFSLNIVSLIRIQFGTIKLKKQKPGEIIEIKKFNLDI